MQCRGSDRSPDESWDFFFFLHHNGTYTFRKGVSLNKKKKNMLHWLKQVGSEAEQMEVNSCPPCVFGPAEEWRGVKPKKNVWHFLLWTKVFFKNLSWRKKKKTHTFGNDSVLSCYSDDGGEPTSNRDEGGDKKLSSENTKRDSRQKKKWPAALWASWTPLARWPRRSAVYNT